MPTFFSNVWVVFSRSKKQNQSRHPSITVFSKILWPNPILCTSYIVTWELPIRFLGLCWLINVENWLSETVKQCKQCTINDRGSAFMAFSGLQLAFNWWFNFIRIYLKNLFFPTLENWVHSAQDWLINIKKWNYNEQIVSTQETWSKATGYERLL